MLKMIFKFIGYIYVIKFVDSIFFDPKRDHFLFLKVNQLSYSLIAAALAIIFLYLGYKKDKK